MSNVQQGIEEPVVQRDAQGKIKSVRLVFGPHHFVNVDLEDGRVHCAIGATHHGIRADASEVNGELERMVNEPQRAHAASAF